MPSPHRSRPTTGLVALSASGGIPGGLPGGSGQPTSGGPSFQKPDGAIYQPPAAGSPGAPVPQGGTYELSGWWRRVGATLIDGLILSIAFVPIAIVVFAALGLSFSESDGDASGAGVFGAILLLLVLGAIYVVLALVYAPYFMAKWNGATPGKKATGIRVVRADGLPMTFGWAAIREVLVKQVLFGWVVGSFTFGLAVLIDYLWPLWDSENRALHDLLVNSRVVVA